VVSLSSAPICRSWKAQNKNASFCGRSALTTTARILREFVRADHYFNLYNQAHGLPCNLALAPNTKVMSAGSSESSAFAVDGSPTTLWSPAADEAAWLRFDFGALHEMTRYVIRHAGAAGDHPARNTRDFTVTASIDGKSWTMIDTIRGNTASVTDVDIPPIQTRYVQITIDHPGDDATAPLADVEIFGSRH